MERVPIESRLCALLAATQHQDPIASANEIDAVLLLETPLPWDDLRAGDPNGTVQQRIAAMRRDHARRRKAEGLAGSRQSYSVAPDGEWSSPGTTRVIVAQRPPGAFSAYERQEYLFPTDAPAILELAEAHFAGDVVSRAVEAYRIEPFEGRDLLVCTNGQVDICCARLGIPAYRVAREAYPAVRAWRTSHFGGHRYAPTAWELPSGYRWGFLDAAAMTALIERDPDTGRLASYMRGWTGVPSPAQLLDREGFRREGWRWLTYRRSAEVLTADLDARAWTVRLTYETPDGRSGAYEGTVEVIREVPSLGCGPAWGERERQSPEYGLRDLMVG